jgi:hypothetical protein
MGVITEGGVLKIVRPIDERRMFCYSERQVIRLVGFLFKTLGADEYFRYLDEYKDFSLRLRTTITISEKEPAFQTPVSNPSHECRTAA